MSADTLQSYSIKSGGRTMRIAARTDAQAKYAAQLRKEFLRKARAAKQAARNLHKQGYSAALGEFLGQV